MFHYIGGIHENYITMGSVYDIIAMFYHHWLLMCPLKFAPVVPAVAVVNISSRSSYLWGLFV